MDQLRLLHYVNQFFAGLGGEDKADLPPRFIEGAVGPGRRLQALLGDKALIIGTFCCGDNYFSDHTAAVLKEAVGIAEEKAVDLLVAGPAFASGRYGFACVEVAHGLSSAGDIYSVSGMYPENPGVDGYKAYKNKRFFLLPTSDKLTGMDDALSRMAAMVLKLVGGAEIGSAKEEGYISRGFRLNASAKQSGAERAVAMLLAKVAGKPFESEIPLEIPKEVPAAPRILDMRNACLAIVSTAGVHPKGNPYGFKVYRNTQYRKYPIEAFGSMKEGEWEVVHGGYNALFMNENPNFGVPLDACRELQKEGAFSRLYGYFYGTTGVEGLTSVMQKLGAEIASDMKSEAIDAAILVST